MRVIISEFFTDANVPQVKKLFKLAKQYSTGLHHVAQAAADAALTGAGVAEEVDGHAP